MTRKWKKDTRKYKRVIWEKVAVVQNGGGGKKEIRRLSSPQFPPVLFSCPRFLIIRSLINYDDDHNDNFKTTIGLMIKTTALHVRHAF